MMKTIIPLFFLFVLFSNHQVLAEKVEPNANITNKDVLMRDGELVITRKDALFVLEDMSIQQRRKVLAEEGRLKNILLDLLVSRKTAQAAREKHLDENKLIAWKIKKLIDQQLVKELTLKYSADITPSDNIELLAKEHYDTHPQDYDVEESIKAAHILFLTADKNKEEKQAQLEKAEKLLKELKNGAASFSEAAKKHSEDKGTAKKGGGLGYFPRGKMVKPFENAVFKLKNKNELSDIVESQFGYHIIKLLDHKPASTISYESVKNKLIEKQKTQYRQKRTGEYIDSFGVTKNTNIYAPALTELFKAESAKLQNELQQKKVSK